MLVMAAMSAYGVINGEASTTTRALTEAAVLVVLAAGVALLAINLLRHKSLAKTPTLLWNGMLVPVSFSLISGGAKLFGVATLVVAVVSFVAALTLPRFDPDEDDEADAVLSRPVDHAACQAEALLDVDDELLDELFEEGLALDDLVGVLAGPPAFTLLPSSWTSLGTTVSR